jgi:prepilin-type processing-associated H-X9-DG protein
LRKKLFAGYLCFPPRIQQLRGLVSFVVAGKANVVFCDGHVESPTLEFLFADTSDAPLGHWNRDHQAHRERLTP